MKLDADKLLNALKLGKGSDEMKAAGLSFGEAKTLSRTGQDPISQAAFGLPLPAKDKPSYGVANDMQGNVVLLSLDEVARLYAGRAEKSDGAGDHPEQCPDCFRSVDVQPAQRSEDQTGRYHRPAAVILANFCNAV